MPEKFLFEIYQQWLQGNENYNQCYDEFINIVMKESGYYKDKDALFDILKTYAWFKYD